ncbi:type IV secretory pathway VirB4 component [Bradyrhizobium sp. USDA 4508]
MLGSANIRVLTIVGFPGATTPGILDDLNRLAFSYRLSTRAIMLDKTDATKLLTKIHVTATITVWDRDPGAADEKLRLVEKIIQGRDFTCMIETVNAVEAWLGSLPGHAYANVRQPPVSTLNLAHMIPMSAVWAGEARDLHFKGPPLLFGKTEGSTPFRFSLHVGDVGQRYPFDKTMPQRSPSSIEQFVLFCAVQPVPPAGWRNDLGHGIIDTNGFSNANAIA